MTDIPYKSAIRSIVLLFSCELVLARLSSQQIYAGDIAISAVGLFLIACAPLPIIARFPGWSRRFMLGLAGFAPLGIVLSGIALVSAIWAKHFWSIVTVFTLLVALHIYGISRSCRGNDPFPGPRLIVTGLAIAVLGVWGFLSNGFPSSWIIVGIGVTWLILLILSRTDKGLALGAALSICAALVPTSSLEIGWSETTLAPTGPDVILLTVDTLRADVAETMTSYKRLAAEGITFSSAQAASPWTLPSLASIMTGLPYQGHGAGRLPDGDFSPIRKSIPTLASILSDHGYDTAAVVGSNPLVSDKFGFDRGFVVYDNPLTRNHHAIPRLDRIGPAYPVVADLVSTLIRGFRPVGGADALLRLARDILQERRDRPILLWVHFFDPHLPYRNATEAELAWTTRMRIDVATSRRTVVGNPRWYTDEGKKALETAYRCEVKQVDDAIVALLDYLESQPARPRVILLTSDHGEEFLDHGQYEHGHALYQEVIGVPLVISATETSNMRGAVERSPVGHEDICPTILELVGITSHSLEGQNLLGTIGDRPYVSQNMLYGGLPDNQFSIREGYWKAIFRTDGTSELYDLNLDPGEVTDLSSEYQEVAEKLKSHFQPVPMDTSTSAADVSEQDLESLRALGYVK